MKRRLTPNLKREKESVSKVTCSVREIINRNLPGERRGDREPNEENHNKNYIFIYKYNII